jgi:hypothetical protein
MVDLSTDINNGLLVSAILSRPILKIDLIFGIDHLSGPTPILYFFIATHLSSRHELLLAIFLLRPLNWAITKNIFLYYIICNLCE